MTYDEMNSFILNYLKNDITGRAIMLTGEWGSGKSYYVKNTLKPFLEDKDNGKHKCVIVSLYGLSDISEISKAIYMELRTIKKAPSSETASTAKAVGKIVGKTIFNGLVSKIGFDIGGISDDDLQEVYESVDLTDKLIVLEDIERTQIDIIELLGYINNMCENDGVKVLLVTNESELLTTYEKSDDKGKVTEYYTDSAIAYIRAKEKTIEDTICFNCDLSDAIKTIIHSFNNDSLSEFDTDECIEDILEIMGSRKCYNLRTFLFACQKTSDIFDKTQKDDLAFNKIVFYSIIAFSMKIKNGVIPNWKGNDLVSTALGLNDYPLYRFCYNYIRWQEFHTEEVDIAVEAHKKMILFDKNGSNKDPDLNVIYYYYEHTEQEVIDALKIVETRLDDPEDIPFYDYSKLAFKLVTLNDILKYDYSKCKNKMVNNIAGKSSEIDSELLFYPFSSQDTESKQEKYQAFIDELKLSVECEKDDYFSYEEDDLEDFYNKLIHDKYQFIKNHAFISNFDIERIAEMIFRCSPAQLQDFRRIMFSVYRHANSYDFIEDDVIAMKSLRDKVSERIANCSESTDRIALQQYRWIIENLDEFISNLSR